jgi:hypothetical protein
MVIMQYLRKYTKMNLSGEVMYIHVSVRILYLRNNRKDLDGI